MILIISSSDWRTLHEVFNDGSEQFQDVRKIPLIDRMMNKITSYMFSLLPKILIRRTSTNAKIGDSMGNVFNVTLSHWNINLSVEELKEQNAIVQELALDMLESH